MLEKVRVCLIGCGRAGMIHARSYMGGIRGAVLTALCDPFTENLNAASEETGVTKLYSDWQDVMKDPEIDALNCFHNATSAFCSIWNRYFL